MTDQNTTDEPKKPADKPMEKNPDVEGAEGPIDT
jgi:hypothetical protein